LKIYNKTIKVTLAKVAPGHEKEVAREIEDGLIHQKIPRNSFRIFRLFGNYDVLIIQEVGRGSSKTLARAGVIPYITGSREFVCYGWERIKRKDHSEKRSFSVSYIKKPLLAACFLKFNSSSNFKLGISLERSFAKYLTTKRQSIQVLGTLGWSECVLLFSSDSLEDLQKGMEATLDLVMKYSKPGEELRTGFIAEKTLTLIGHDIEVSDPRRRLEVIELSEKLREKKLDVYLNMACKPRHMSALQSSLTKIFDDDGGEVNYRLGAYDLEYKIPLRNIKTLNELIDKLDTFRNENETRLIRTHTDFQFREHTEFPPGAEQDIYFPIIVGVDRKEAKKILTIEYGGDEILKTIYWFNNFIENDLLTESFEDLVPSVLEIKRKALDNQSRPEYLKELLTRAFFLQYAMYERAEGAYVGIEEVPLGTVPFSAGIQRILKALEVYPITVLKRLNQEWDGFCVVGYFPSRFEHYQEIMMVPTEAAFKPELHWGLTHEAMHVLVNASPQMFSFRRREFQESIRRAYGPKGILFEEQRWDLFVETLCDILDYEISCPLIVEDYLKIVWDYLSKNIFERIQEKQFRSYLLRSFSVFVYNRYFENGGGAKSCTPTELRKAFQKFQGILYGFLPRGLLEKRETANVSFRDNIISESVRIKEIFEPIRDILGKYDPPVICPRTPYDRKKMIETIRKVRKGAILNIKEIENADRLAWLIRSNYPEGLGPGGFFAYTLSLWNYYYIRKLGRNLEKVWVFSK
jgi:hypothetical protein